MQNISLAPETLTAGKVRFKACAEVLLSAGSLEYDRSSIVVKKPSQLEVDDWEVFRKELEIKNVEEQTFRSSSELFPEKPIPKKRASLINNSISSISNKIEPKPSEIWGSGAATLPRKAPSQLSEIKSEKTAPPLATPNSASDEILLTPKNEKIMRERRASFAGYEGNMHNDIKQKGNLKIALPSPAEKGSRSSFIW